MVGRVSDGLPLAQGPRYVNEENDNFLCYKQQGEFILREISRGDLTPTKMTIRIDHHSFNYLIENGVCFMTLCDSSYPRKLAFHYLQDLQKEFEKFHHSLLIQKISRPYSFVKFGKLYNPTLLNGACHIYMHGKLAVGVLGASVQIKGKNYKQNVFVLATCVQLWSADGVIGNIRKQYIDTRTQTNLSKLNANRKKDLEIITEHISEILQRKRNSEISERLPETPRTVSPIWSSPLLEVCSINKETV
ncbi:unnamed protein product [Dovyalis caffra]|uniref:Longin domain-containing protein n=1 Tax=Dovyalis caffra TaxID=77055 RepID=A0AAV1RKL0_9ROSI|nr:unnamed protein product [Dovyalis caffra]